MVLGLDGQPPSLFVCIDGRFRRGWVVGWHLVICTAGVFTVGRACPGDYGCRLQLLAFVVLLLVCWF
jgi:hypothetical protein